MLENEGAFGIAHALKSAQFAAHFRPTLEEVFESIHQNPIKGEW